MSKWKEWKESLGDSRPWHLLDPNKHVSDEDLAKKRLNICSGCEFYTKLTTQCQKCGCVMPLKVHLAEAECPIGKWGKEQNV
jgi:hypothetical protein